SALSLPQIDALDPGETAGRGPWGRRLARARRMRLAGVGLVILVIAAIVALSAPLIAPYDPADVSLIDRLKPPPTPGHLLGTDPLGQDVLSRVIYGTRVSLTVGFLVVAISGTIGVSLGLISGYYGGWIDDVVMRV